ncbi:MAG TPA: hypothetical protein VJU83_05280 [Burkholderiales bacterium]|nr:hypothetical protein [Burkholderiales bacterium]
MRNPRYLAPFVDDNFLSSSPTRIAGSDDLNIKDFQTGLHVIVAQSPEDVAAAQQLVAQRYAWRGYNTEISTVKAGDSVTLIAKQGDDTVGTLSVRFDSEQGLSADEIFGPEVDSRRHKGGRVCELTRLAISTGIKSSEVLGLLVRLSFMVCRGLRAATDVFIEVNPRHERFYRHILDFNVASDRRICPRVSAPAVLLHLDLCGLERSLQKLMNCYAPEEIPLAA